MLSKLRRCIPTITQIRQTTTATQSKYKSCDEVPGPDDSLWTVLRNGKENFGRNHFLYSEWAETYGPIFRQNIPLTNKQIFSLNDPHLIEEFMRQDSKTPMRPAVPIWDHATEKLKAANGILRANGEEWYHMRNVINQKFMKQKAVDEYFPEIDQVASDYIKRLDKLRDDKKIVHNLPTEMFNWALESVGTVLYERRLGCIDDDRSHETVEFIKAVRTMFETTLHLYIIPPTLAQIVARKKYKQHLQAWVTMLGVAEKNINIKMNEIKNKKRSEDEPVGLIEYMLSSNKLSMKELSANITELMAGGVDTTSNAIQFLMYEVAKNPEVQNKLYQEIQEHIGNAKVITPEMVKHMSYLKAVIKETLRMYPIAFSVGRIVLNDVVLNGYLIPKGKWVAFVPYVLGRHKSLFEDPDTFKPERWLRSNINREKSHPFAYLPFGFGARGCVGRRLAEAEMQVLVAKIFQKFRLELVDQKPLETFATLTISPAKPLELYYIDRS